jgi:hypothetical protein
MGYFFTKVKVYCINVDKNVMGLHSGDFFQQLIWSQSYVRSRGTAQLIAWRVSILKLFFSDVKTL